MAEAIAQPYTETVLVGDRNYVVSAVTLKDAQSIDWTGPNFLRDIVFASLRAGGEAETLTPEDVETMPYMPVVLPLFQAAKRVNGLTSPGEATAATTTDAA